MKNILVVNNGTNSLGLLVKLLSKLGPVRVVSVEVFHPELVEDEIVVFSGSSTYNVDNDSENFQHIMRFITETDKVVVGVCFGFQLLCKAYGGTMMRMIEPTKDIITIELADGRTITASSRHKWIVNGLSDDFEILGESQDGIEIVKHNLKPQIGFQFHPEVFMELTEGDETFLSLVKPLVNGVK